MRDDTTVASRGDGSSDTPANPEPTPAEILGHVVSLMTASADHRELPLREIERRIGPPLRLRQFMLFRRKGLPIGYASWAFVSDKVRARLGTGDHDLTPAEWKSGGNLIVMDIVAPAGGKERMLSELDGAMFKGRKIETFDNLSGSSSPAQNSETEGRVRPARGSDVLELAPKLRESDVQELKAASGRDPAGALSLSMTNAKRCWTVLKGDQVIGMFGVGYVEGQPKTGRVWFLASDEINSVS